MIAPPGTLRPTHTRSQAVVKLRIRRQNGIRRRQINIAGPGSRGSLPAGNGEIGGGSVQLWVLKQRPAWMHCSQAVSNRRPPGRTPIVTAVLRTQLWSGCDWHSAGNR